ncbi:MAG: hypothetical protein AAF223_13890, partial [Bacteroidota bacterium]
FPFQNEDADLSWRVRAMGKVVFSPEVLMTHPPRQDPFFKNAKKMKHYVSEFMLFHKNPALYQKYRCANPWELIYWRVMIKAQGYHFLTRIKFIRQPWVMIQGIALSLYWWGDLLSKWPTFWRADHKYRQLYAQNTSNVNISSESYDRRSKETSLRSEIH